MRSAYEQADADADAIASGPGAAGSSRGAAGAPAYHRGLRERKKAKTRAAIRQHALRLFREQGYHATTGEVSPVSGHL